MTERKYNECHDRQKTHELVALNNTPASSPEQNYAQLKTIRSPDNTYEQLVLRQVSHNEVCEDELKDKENEVTHEERCQTGGYKTEGEKTKCFCLCSIYWHPYHHSSIHQCNDSGNYWPITCKRYRR